MIEREEMVAARSGLHERRIDLVTTYSGIGIHPLEKEINTDINRQLGTAALVGVNIASDAEGFVYAMAFWVAYEP
jgi:hypothetical protein